MTTIITELQSLSPSAIIELFQLYTYANLHGSTNTYYFHSGVNSRLFPGAVVWNGTKYEAFPIQATGFEYSGTGTLPRPTLTVSNLFSTITSILLSINDTNPGNDLIGAKLVRIRTCARYLDAVNFENNQNPYGTPDPTAEMPREIYYVDRKVSENRDAVQFELTSSLDLIGVRLPGRQCISSVCQWVYRGAECGYSGAAGFDENDDPLTTVVATNFVFNDATLTAGQSLGPNEYLTSANGWYRLLMQEDGNLVIYNKALVAVWNTLTFGKGLSRFIYQEDGNLVVYDATGNPTWYANTENLASITTLEFAKLLPLIYPQGDFDSAAMVAATNFSAGTSSVSTTGSGYKLYAGDSLTSANGWYQLLMQRDGNLVVYNKANEPVWFTATAGAAYAWFQPDGNLVVYRISDGTAIWASNTSIKGTTVYVPATNFQTGTGQITASNTNASKLLSGQSIYSSNGWYRLTMQADGNLVITNKANVVTWATNTAGSGATFAWFQADGNFVLYDNSLNVKWTSWNGPNYPYNTGTLLWLQPDGNLVIYNAAGQFLWYSGTPSTVEPTVPSTTPATGTLTMQDDGNLSINSSATNLWNAGYSSAVEPTVKSETGDNRAHTFFWEIFGSGTSQSGVTKNVTRAFTFGARSITLRFNGTANVNLPTSPTPHYSGESKSWTLNSTTFISSTGKWYRDEWFDLIIATSTNNPFRNHPLGTITESGRQYRITGVSSSTGTLTLQNDGNLVLGDGSGNPLYSIGYSNTTEPKVATGAGGGTAEDVCGKRLNSCRVRFGSNVDLPFGSFPGVGQYF